MDKKIKLIPGICDTKNRHYLPEKLLDGKTTVNENETIHRFIREI